MATVDGLTLYTSVCEMQKCLTGGRVDKINQPEKDEIHIVIRSGGKNYKVLISACPDSCRIQITDSKKPNPISAPMFCMLLRKHLSGGKILAITQINTDRIVKIDVENTDELSNTGYFSLYCELMGRHSNIILVNSDGIIMESIKRIGITMSQARVVMPGVKYQSPPTDIKKDPLMSEKSDIEKALAGTGKADKLLSSAFYGVAPCVANEMLSASGISKEYAQDFSDNERACASETIHEIFKSIQKGETTPCILTCGEKDFFMPFICSDGECKTYDSTGCMFDAYYAERDMREYMRRRSYTLIHTIETKISRLQKKLAGFDEAIMSESDYDKYRIYGELISANLYKIRPGQKEVIADNYYDVPQTQITIKLDESLSAVRNSQRYFKLYKKAKGARDNALSMRTTVQSELDYLCGIIDCIQRAESTDELDEIRRELEALRFVRNEQGQKKKKSPKKLAPISYVSNDGYEILVGRNNYQNDELTFKIAAANDMWLHVKDRPGSHTIIVKRDMQDIPDTTLYEAAVYAARHSSAAQSGAKIEVDYTLCRYVKKPSGALPGKVIYTNQKTMLVCP